MLFKCFRLFRCTGRDHTNLNVTSSFFLLAKRGARCKLGTWRISCYSCRLSPIKREFLPWFCWVGIQRALIVKETYVTARVLRLAVSCTLFFSSIYYEYVSLCTCIYLMLSFIFTLTHKEFRSSQTFLQAHNSNVPSPYFSISFWWI